MEEKFFITKFGQKIPIIPSYRLAHNQFYSQDVISGHDKEFDSEKSLNAQFTEFFQDFYEYAIMIDFLESIGIKRKWNSALDIGGQQGYVSRFLIGEEKTNSADCIELSDYGKHLNLKKMKWFYNRYKMWKLAKKLNFNYKNQVLKVLNAFQTMCDNYGYYPNHDSKFWKLKFTKDPNITNYIIEDIYKLNKKYDFISALLCLEYFNYKTLFKKINELLNEDGIFIFFVNYWWWPVNSTRIVGNFPYAAQRLEKDDFILYLKEFHTDQLSDFIQRYDYFCDGLDEKPTLSQYISEAEQKNLSLIGCRRFMPTASTHSKTPICPPILDQYDDSKLIEILENIHTFRKDVVIEDLKTAYIMCVFRKKTSKHRSITERVEELEKTGYGSYNKINSKK